MAVPNVGAWLAGGACGINSKLANDLFAMEVCPLRLHERQASIIRRWVVGGGGGGGGGVGGGGGEKKKKKKKTKCIISQ